MEIDANLAVQALKEGLAKYPQYAGNGARVAWRPLFKGGALLLEYEKAPERGDPDAWEFQNVVVKAYKRLAGA
jgi:hypothetical protein